MATPTTRPPEQVEQSLDALGQANQIRMLRAARKRDLASGRLTTAQLIMDPPWYMQDVRVFEVLEDTPWFGRKKTRKLNADLMRGRDRIGMPQISVNLFTTLGQLTPRQREWLVEQLPGCCKPAPQQ